MLFSNLEISPETGLEKSLITVDILPLTIPERGSNFDLPLEEAHQPDGRPAGRQRRATEKRTSAQVVLSTSPRPDSVIAGRTTDKGDSRGRTRSLEIDARRCKPHQAIRLERASAQESRTDHSRRNEPHRRSGNLPPQHSTRRAVAGKREMGFLWQGAIENQ